MIYIFTSSGIIAVEGGATAVAAIRTAGLQIVDDLAGVASHVDDAASLLDLVRNSFSGNGLESINIVGAVAFGGAISAGIAVGAIPLAGSAAAVIGVGWAAGKLYDWAFDSATQIGQKFGQSAFEMWGEPIDPLIHTTYRTAATTRPQPIVRDPLAIDLDGDGIETVGIGSNGQPITFDHNADGVRTGSGWLKGDDAWLVLDRNGNGTIDSGRELFGVDYLKANNQFATSGLDALRDLDSNADGVFNSSDAAFAQVKLWQDLNQDGQSQASELFSLADKGIASIGLNGTTANTNLGNGNSVGATAVVTRSDGSTATAADLNLAHNPFFRRFTNGVPLNDAAQALPQMQGNGWVRDLRKAVTTSDWYSVETFANRRREGDLSRESNWNRLYK
jgi:hypothetical protein